jgi:hypothetical protein
VQGPVHGSQEDRRGGRRVRGAAFLPDGKLTFYFAGKFADFESEEGLTRGVTGGTGAYRDAEADLVDRRQYTMRRMRHRRDHLRRTVVKLRQAQEHKSAATALERVEELYSKARGILDDAENDGQITLSLQAIADLRRTVELLAKLTGEIDERPAEREARIAQETSAMIANVFICSLRRQLTRS